MHLPDLILLIVVILRLSFDTVW
ncbi:hypothetical protein NSMM_410096 [Nitrosomonas mobilis]|uniref:Uncharacterized protein n=1 Tax=Nitrosomonas mobilis TaxID=51642 RepID=A0A1G5SH37_9PROT|nr:hypothetical protein NSMM_410096 [Nitrosomonas mobilis]